MPVEDTVQPRNNEDLNNIITNRRVWSQCQESEGGDGTRLFPRSDPAFRLWRCGADAEGRGFAPRRVANPSSVFPAAAQVLQAAGGVSAQAGPAGGGPGERGALAVGAAGPRRRAAARAPRPLDPAQDGRGQTGSRGAAAAVRARRERGRGGGGGASAWPRRSQRARDGDRPCAGEAKP